MTTYSPQQGCIERLPQSVINRIAAGEVVIRPSAALKELLENSLDANSTSIQVIARDGGLKSLQITDDGDGIHTKDLSLLCERFATSKLKHYTDLQNGYINTFGFRGEALSSVSHVSRLCVITKHKNDHIGYTAMYDSNGKLINTNPCARGSKGSTIIVDDLFYNLPTRKSALKSYNEEYRSIVDVVSKYSIKYPNVSFTCRKQSNNNNVHGSSISADVRTRKDSNRKDNIRCAFGGIISNQCMDIKINIKDLNVNIDGMISNSNFSMKKRGIYIFFINGRLVDCNTLKKNIINVYSNYLPKGTQPFIYMELNMLQKDIDINVHPMKKEVRFLNEDLIIQNVVNEITRLLKHTENSRTFLAQSVIVPTKNNRTCINDDDDVDDDVKEKGHGLGILIVPSVDKTKNKTLHDDDDYDSDDSDDDGIDIDLEESSAKKRARKSTTPSSQQLINSNNRKQYAKDKVRTGSHNPVGLLDKYITSTPSILNNTEKTIQLTQPSPQKRKSKSVRSTNAPPLLTSIEILLENMKRNAHTGMIETLRNHTFIGKVSNEFVLLQHGIQLLLVEIQPLITELAYENILLRFADHIPNVEINPGAPVKRLIQQYIKKNLNKNHNIIDSGSCSMLLMEKSKLLEEYFGIQFKDDDNTDINNLTLCGLPGLIFDNNYIVISNMKHLGELLYNVAVHTNWNEESKCFQSISLTLASWFAKYWLPVKTNSIINKQGEKIKSDVDKKDMDERYEWILRHVIFEAMRNEFYPPKKLHTQNVIREITSTCKLYKVFERC